MNKMFFDFFPLIIFFVVYKFGGDIDWIIQEESDNRAIINATAALIPATIFQILYGRLTTGKVEKTHLVTLVLVVVLGTATVMLQDDAFIKWKPSVVNWLFAAGFFGSQFIGKQNLLQRMMGTQISLPDPIWFRLNMMWVSFFIFSGLANVYVAFSGQFDQETWVNFKVFGMLGLTLVFIILQGIYLSRHISEEDMQASKSENTD